MWKYLDKNEIDAVLTKARDMGIDKEQIKFSDIVSAMFSISQNQESPHEETEIPAIPVTPAASRGEVPTTRSAEEGVGTDLMSKFYSRIQQSVENFASILSELSRSSLDIISKALQSSHFINIKQFINALKCIDVIKSLEQNVITAREDTDEESEEITQNNDNFENKLKKVFLDSKENIQNFVQSLIKYEALSFEEFNIIIDFLLYFSHYIIEDETIQDESFVERIHIDIISALCNTEFFQGKELSKLNVDEKSKLTGMIKSYLDKLTQMLMHKYSCECNDIYDGWELRTHSNDPKVHFIIHLENIKKIIYTLIHPHFLINNFIPKIEKLKNDYTSLQNVQGMLEKDKQQNTELEEKFTDIANMVISYLERISGVQVSTHASDARPTTPDLVASAVIPPRSAGPYLETTRYPVAGIGVGSPVARPADSASAARPSPTSAERPGLLHKFQEI